MKTRLGIVLVAFALAGAMLALDVAAQGRGGGGRGGGGGGGGRSGGPGGGGRRGGRLDAVRNRLNPVFVKATPPASGQPVGEYDYYESIKEIREAAGKGQVSLLYLYSSPVRKPLKRFENTLFTFRNEPVAVALKVFRCVKLDVAHDTVAQAAYARKVPVFIAFDAKGKRVDETALPGYKASSGALIKLLGKAARGHVRPSLNAWVKKYRKLMNELDQVERDKKALNAKKARLEQDDRPARGKIRKVEKEEKALAKREKKILERERKLLAAVKAPETTRPRP